MIRQIVPVIYDSIREYRDICEASLQNPQNVAQNEIVVILDYNLISLNRL